MMSGIVRQYARTDIRKQSFAIRVVETWNLLSDRDKLTQKTGVLEEIKTIMALTLKERIEKRKKARKKIP
jgi:hypothetical protein